MKKNRIVLKKQKIQRKVRICPEFWIFTESLFYAQENSAKLLGRKGAELWKT